MAETVTEESDITDPISVLCRDLTPEEEIIDYEPPTSDSVEPNTYNIKPMLQDKFKTTLVKDVIHTVLNEELSGKVYCAKEAKKWTKLIANHINIKIRDMKWKRYKHVVQVVIGEQRGAGVKSGVKCVWDSETDNYASDVFTNDSVFCLAAVFAVYFY